MRGYSIDLRERVVRAVKEEKQGTKEVAKRLGLSRWSVNRYLKREAEGKLAASTPPGRPQSLDAAALKVLKRQLKEHSDWTLEQHAEGLNKAKVSKLKKSSIGNYFKRLGITIKKDFYPQERDEQARKTWLEALAKVYVKKLVFLDETSSFVNISRSGWAASHERLVDSFPKGKNNV